MFEIRKSGSPCLKQVSAEVPLNTNVQSLIDTMWLVMDYNKGLGLAANQIGEMVRVIVISASGFRQAFINPVITRKYGGQKNVREGCLSFPGLEVRTSRYKRIYLEGYDENWQPIKRKLGGMAAVCAQHEVEHLDGKTII